MYRGVQSDNMSSIIIEIDQPDEVNIANPFCLAFARDFLFNLNIERNGDNLQHAYGDVKFVCMAATKARAKDFARYMQDLLGLQKEGPLINISKAAERYAMFKVGPVLCVSHGVGMPSVSIVLHEIIKLVFYAKCKDPIFFKIGSCCGISLEPGTVVVSDKTVDGLLRPFFESYILGKIILRPAELDQNLMAEVIAINCIEEFPIAHGTTLCTMYFYEGQGRLDGAICKYTSTERTDFLKKLQLAGIQNIDMEALAFASITHEAGIKASVIGVVGLNRLNDYQVLPSPSVVNEWKTRPQRMVGNYIEFYLNK